MCSAPQESIGVVRSLVLEKPTKARARMLLISWPVAGLQAEFEGQLTFIASIGKRFQTREIVLPVPDKPNIFSRKVYGRIVVGRM